MQETSLFFCLTSLLCVGLPLFLFVFFTFRPKEWLKMKNKVGRHFGKVEWVVPHNLNWDEQRIVENAHKLAFFEIPQALKKAPISSTKKSQVEQQANKIPENIVHLMEKLAQVRRLRESISRYDRHGNSNQGYEEIRQMEKEILAEVNYSMEVLSSIPISLVRLEISRGDISVEKILSRMDNANSRMKNLASTYKSEKQQARGW